MNSKHPIVVIIVAAIVIIVLYYLMSPYQNCVRNNAGEIGLSENLHPSEEQVVQEMCFEMTSW